MMFVFPFAVACLELGAALVYAYNHQWALAITWFCYAVAAFALGTVR